MTIVTGDEADAFSRTPAPVLLIAEKVGLDGNKTEIARANLPADSLSLGELSRTEVGGIAVTALGADGQPLLRGESLFVQWGALENQTLEVFVQRTGELARMPRGPSPVNVTTITTIVGRYVLTTDGTASNIYDLLTLHTLSSPPVLPRPAKSTASFGTAALLIDESGATTFDLSNGETVALDPPIGGTFAEVAGGERVSAPDGTQLIVGGTRSSGATPRVFLVDSNGKATFSALTAAREGACATYVEGRGLVVYGGDAKASAVELLAPGATGASALPFPPDPVKGCSLATLDNQHVLVAGGTGAAGDTGAGLPPRVIDLACTTACAPIPWPSAPVVLTRAQSFGLSFDKAFIVGDDANGATHAYRAMPTELREIPLKIGRQHARMIPTPTKSVVIVGGGAGIEQYLE